MSTVSLNRDEDSGGSDLGESAPTVNGTISTDCKRDDQHRLQTGRYMSGGDFGGKLDRECFWAGLSFVFSFLCRFSFLSCCLFRLLVGVCFRS